MLDDGDGLETSVACLRNPEIADRRPLIGQSLVFERELHAPDERAGVDPAGVAEFVQAQVCHGHLRPAA